MILEQITLHNFRQYYGTSRITFSMDKQKNITVIHGENGAGKTALLNAFNWCLYGKLDLDFPEDIINHTVEVDTPVGETVLAYVQLNFLDNDRRKFTVTRSIKAEKQADNKLLYFNPVLQVRYIDVDGKTIETKSGQSLINQIIPPEMSSYFFFDGERIDKMQDKEKAKDMKQAIKNVMGLEIFERSIKHLKKVKREFMKEFAQLGTEKDQQLMKEIERLEAKIASSKQRVDEEKANLQAITTQIKEIQQKLRTLEETKDLQEQYDQLENDKKELEEKLKTNRSQLTHLISKNGYLAFAKDLIEKANRFLDDKREKNQIPTGIKQQFVKDLLEKGECICGRPLHEHTPEYELLHSWLSRSSSKELEDAYIDTAAGLKIAENERQYLYDRLHELHKERHDMIRSRNQILEEINEIQAKLDGKDQEEISALNNKKKELDQQLEATKDRIRDLEYDIKQDSKQLEEKTREIEKIQSQNAKAELARKRANKCEILKKAFEEILHARDQEVQYDLQTKISEVYSRLLRKDFTIKLSENYDIKVYRMVSGELKPVAMSQGERQITSLSFIGTLVNIAREQYEKNKEEESSSMKFGGYYPIVMDSPFGQLDQDHRSRVATSLPDLAHQIIVIVSSSQWEGEVWEKMQHRVGKEYRLNYIPEKQYTEIEEVKPS